MSEPLVRYVGDRNPAITETITIDGVAFDLSASTVRFKMRLVGSATLKVDAAATIVSAPAGTVSYGPAAIDVDTQGLYLIWWEVTTATLVQAVLESLVEIRAHSPVTGALCELEEVRLAMELPTTDRTLDARIRELIAVASSALADEVKRELYSVGALTRRRATIGDRILSLSPWDLRTATTVILDPDGQNQTLVANVDYRLLPIGGSDVLGTFTELELADTLSLEDGTGFDDVVVSIAGTWGPATVPREAREACVLCVRSWLRRDVSTYAGFADDSGGRVFAPTGAYGIPAAARNMLGRLYRFPNGGGVA